MSSAASLSPIHPENVEVTKQRILDYSIYDFFLDEQPIMRAYTGYHPAFSDCVKGYRVTKTELNGLKGESSVRRDRVTGLISSDVLVCVDRNDPFYIHFWYGNLDAEKAAVCDAVISSIKKTGPDSTFIPPIPPTPPKGLWDRFVDWIRTLL